MPRPFWGDFRNPAWRLRAERAVGSCRARASACSRIRSGSGAWIAEWLAVISLVVTSRSMGNQAVTGTRSRSRLIRASGVIPSASASKVSRSRCRSTS